ncbi:flagellar motor switch protein FliN [Buchnera aphidicola]|uniref:Flagellar motor switch protein FliN n=1 Tax=Buchnera aphidicola (Cinara cf. splendens/pseudotsugae 3390) TaxID=2518980 RepID=A0A451CWM5_9GAMM|nr:flagellar motor switch protein FliN [Buchnera aphidicola]VFP77621.1 Flagellar motor switch protein FliN [Buchnera aphidicola (Cinara cf. splendens/pseudotsugae 3390)]
MPDSFEKLKNNEIKQKINFFNTKDKISITDTKDINCKNFNLTDNKKKIIDDTTSYNLSFMSIPVYITIELSKKKITIKDLLKLSSGSVLELEDKVDEPLNIYVNKHLIAIGELVVHNDKYGVRIIKLL